LEDTIKVIVLKAIEDNVIEADQLICSGTDSDTITQVAGTYIKGDLATPAYKWLSSATDDDDAYAGATPASADSFFVGKAIETDTYYKRIALAQDGICPDDTSEPVLISVIPPITGNVIYDDEEICSGASVDLSGDPIEAVAGTEPVYQWLQG